MSAWLVSKEHIDVLVTAQVALGIIESESAQQVGLEMWCENVASLTARYGDSHSDYPEVLAYEFAPLPTEDLVFVLKQANCYQYQSCEHDAWENSDAHTLNEALKAQIEKRIGPDAINSADYVRACWGVDMDENGHMFLTMEEWSLWMCKQNAS